MAAPTRPDYAARIREAMSQVPTEALSAQDTEILTWLSGWDDDVVEGVCSLLRLASIYTHPAPAPRPPEQVLPSAHLVDRVAPPEGADPDAAAGLPSFMTVGLDIEGPWWHCTRCCKARRGLADTATEAVSAKDHLDTFHQGWRDGR